MTLPQFNEHGVLPVGIHPISLVDLRQSYLVTGEGLGISGWDVAWRSQLIENLEVMMQQLRAVGIDQVFIDGSFVENKEHPNDIDGYFECDLLYHVSGEMERELNQLDEHRIWVWDPTSKQMDVESGIPRLPMWHVYHVELYPHHPQLVLNISDEDGLGVPFPSVFGRTRLGVPKGLIQVVP